MVNRVSAKPKQRRAAIYLRMSLDTTGEGLGIDRQRVECEQVAKSKGWEIVGEYVDNSFSASKAKVVRPGYEQLMTDLTLNKFEAVICYDLDRLTRQPRQLEDWIDLSRERDIALITANGEADLTTDSGRMFAGIKIQFARAEVERKGERQRVAAKQRAALGKVPKGTRLLGYETDGSLITAEAKIVRKIFEMFLKGENIKAICDYLTSAGVPTRWANKGWDTATIRGILTNYRYAGISTYRVQERREDGTAFWARYEAGKGNWNPIVEEQKFRLVQSKLSNPARKTNHVGHTRKYLGSSIYLCGVCKHPLRVNGKSYWCPEGNHTHRIAHWIDDFVCEIVETRLSQPKAIANFEASNDGELEDLDAATQELLERLATLEFDYDEGNIDGNRFKTASDKVKDKLSKLEITRARIVGGFALESVLDKGNPADAFRNASLAVRRAVIDRMVSVIVLPGVKGVKTFRPESVKIAWKK
jgi:DNA invertase Pin-like site-specific DNA recombinase